MLIKILECRKFSTPISMRTTPRVVKDYEIDLELEGEREIVIDGITHTIRKGDVCIRKPGQVCYTIGQQDSIVLTVDFSDSAKDSNYNRNVPGTLQKICESELVTDLEGIIHPSSTYLFMPIYTELLKLSPRDEDARGLLIMELLHKLNAEACRRKYVAAKPQETAYSKVLNYMRENCDQHITLQQLADLVHLNKNYLARTFQAVYGQAPIEVLISIRMEKACDLVTNTDLRINEIASMCGYQDTSYFISQYKKYYGQSPLKHRAGE